MSSTTTPSVPFIEAILSAWPLPPMGQAMGPRARGTVVVLAGGRGTARAAVLAGTAAWRAGVERLVIGTARSVAAEVQAAVPEARVLALPESAAGGLAAEGVEGLAALLADAGSVLIGPGLPDGDETAAFVGRVLAELCDTPVVLDAAALTAVAHLERSAPPLLLTPRAGEMAQLSGTACNGVESDAVGAARRAASMWNAVVALKGGSGGCSVIASPAGDAWRHDGGHVGLATAGSGDVLAGLIAGLLARGAQREQAAAWAVFLLDRAGAQLAWAHGQLGYRAGELATHVPKVLHEWSGRRNEAAVAPGIAGRGTGRSE